MESLVSIRGLEKRFGDFKLESIDLSVDAGCVTGLVGSNGAGKSTTIKSLLGLVNPDAGRIALFGEELFGPASEGGYRRAAAIDYRQCMAQVGYVPDTCPFPLTLPLSSIDPLGQAMHATWDSVRFNRLLGEFGITGKKTVKQLSRGMTMKLSLAAALSFETRLLVLDDATAGLDPIARDETLDIQLDYVSDGEHGILFSTHITSDLEKVADTVVCIDAGRGVFDVPKDDLRERFGVAHCRTDQVEPVTAHCKAAGDRALARRHAYSVDVLVPDRFGFARAFPDIPCDPISIEEFMTFHIRGEEL